MAVSEHPDPMSEWRDLIGGFILAFGEIELLTFTLWRAHIMQSPIPHNFKERTGRILSEMRRHDGQYALAIAVLESSLRLADKRNTVAHHPMQVQVYRHSLTGEYFLEHAICSEISDDYITDDELRRLRRDTESLARQLYLAMGYPDLRGGSL